jgi:uncharacterized OB-fold protein
MLKIQVGYDVRSKATANKVVTKLKSISKREGRLGRYEIIKAGEDWQTFHILTEEEKAIMSTKCATEGHMLHYAGYCVKCHTQVEVSRR